MKLTLALLSLLAISSTAFASQMTLDKTTCLQMEKNHTVSIVKLNLNAAQMTDEEIAEAVNSLNYQAIINNDLCSAVDVHFTVIN